MDKNYEQLLTQHLYRLKCSGKAPWLAAVSRIQDQKTWDSKKTDEGSIPEKEDGKTVYVKLFGELDMIRHTSRLSQSGKAAWLEET